MPEFIPPTPAYNQSAPLHVRAYMGLLLLLPLHAQLRRDPSQLEMRVPVDPGLPIWSSLSPPVLGLLGMASGSAALLKTNFSWTPICQQGQCLQRVKNVLGQEGSYNVEVVISQVGAPDVTSSKLLAIDVATPDFETIGMDFSSRTLHVDCPYLFLFPIRAIEEDIRAQPDLPLYSPHFTFDVALYSPLAPNSTSNSPSLELLDTVSWKDRFSPRAPTRNDDGSWSGWLQWTPARGQEGLRYRVCARVRDGCAKTSSSPKLSVCVDAAVARCRACLPTAGSLESLAIAYRQNFLNVYSFNPFISDPDFIAQGIPINVGSLYSVKNGDSLFSLSEQFHTTVESFLEMNPDLAMRNGMVLFDADGRRHAGSANASGNLALLAGDVLCVVLPACDSQPNVIRSLL